MLDNTIDKIKSIKLPEISCKNTLITITVIGSGLLIYNHSKTIINSMKNILLGNCCEKTTDIELDILDTSVSPSIQDTQDTQDTPESVKA